MAPCELPTSDARLSEIGVDARVVILILALDGLLQRFGRQAKAFRKLLNGIGHHDIAILDQAFVDALGSFERHIGRAPLSKGKTHVSHVYAKLASIHSRRSSMLSRAGHRSTVVCPPSHCRYNPATKSNGCAGSCREASRSCRSALSFPKCEIIFILGNCAPAFAAWHAS